MLATLLTKISIAFIVLILLGIIIRGRALVNKIYLLLFFTLYFADNFLIILANQYPALQVIPNHVWEGFLVCSWSGKLYSIIFTCLVIYLSRKIINYQEVGLTFHQSKNSILPSMLVLFGIAIWATVIGIFSPKGIFDGETLLYLALMPALNEELVYRGFLLGMMNKITRARLNVFGAEIGWGVLVTSILFSLLHGFSFDNNLSIHIDLIALRNSFISGFIFAWLRERTGSLVMPMIAHGLEDFLFFLPRMV